METKAGFRLYEVEGGAVCVQYNHEGKPRICNLFDNTVEARAFAYQNRSLGPVLNDDFPSMAKQAREAAHEGNAALDRAEERNRMPGWAALSRAFGEEFTSLSDADAELVRHDYMDAVAEDYIGAQEYRRRIGAGNLKAYAEVLAVHARRSA